MRLRYCFLISATVGLLLGLPAVSHAQTATNPLSVSFDVSPDHTAINPLDGTAVVSRYDLSWVVMNQTGALAFTKAIGKPTVDGSNRATVNVPEFAATTGAGSLTANQLYTLVVIAVGPGGSTPSTPSNPFGRSGPLKVPAAPAGVVVK